MFLPPRALGQDWFGVLIAIPEPWVTQLTELRLRLGDLQGAQIPAHITLMPPVPVPVDQREEVIQHLRRVAAAHQPFRIRLHGGDSFRPASPVAYVKLDQGAHECQELALDVASGPLAIPQRFPYHPHVTLAQDVDESAIDLAVDMGDMFEASWLVPGFRLDRVDPTGMYSSMALFDFEADRAV